jgi:HPt (histidine-containing phosphotransfer) domain-containing protein
MAERPLFDAAQLEALRALQGEGEDLVAEVAATFLSDVPARLARLRACAESGDARELERHAHNLKSSAALVGALELSDRSSALEAAASDAASWGERVAAVEETFARTREALERHLVTRRG